MLESLVELLVGLVLSALILLIGSGIPGSIIVALRAVSRESYRKPEEVTVLDDRISGIRNVLVQRVPSVSNVAKMVRKPRNPVLE